MTHRKKPRGVWGGNAFWSGSPWRGMRQARYPKALARWRARHPLEAARIDLRYKQNNPT